MYFDEDDIKGIAQKYMSMSEVKKEDASNDKSDDGEGLDKVDPKAAKKKFKNRKDKDIDNDGDTDDSDEYLHKKRKAVTKAVEKEDKEQQMFVYHIRDSKQKEGNIHARSKIEAAVKARDNGFRPPMSVTDKGPYNEEVEMKEEKVKATHEASPKADWVEPETDGHNARAMADMTKGAIDAMFKGKVVHDYPTEKQDGSAAASKSPEPRTLRDIRK
tara:strand:+ start:788 stop:1435 length:648 start_codon:yes stop_codon:yes gene_type:complete